jgi:hypothetical protein
MSSASAHILVDWSGRGRYHLQQSWPTFDVRRSFSKDEIRIVCSCTYHPSMQSDCPESFRDESVVDTGLESN